MHRSSLILFAIGFVASVSSAQSVWVVDDHGGPTAHFTELRDAVAAAAPGDFVLVRNGRYQGGIVITKPLTISAAAGHAPVIGDVQNGEPFPLHDSGTVEVRGLLAGEEVYLHGLKIESMWSHFYSGRPNLRLMENEGEVWVEGCVFDRGTLGVSIGLHGEGIQAIDCTGVTVANCVIQGMDPGQGAAIYSSDTNFTLFGSSVTGAEGGTGGLFPASPDGGAAVRVFGGVFYAMGSSLTAGDGYGGSAGAGDGGDAVFGDAAALVRLRDCTFVAGLGGVGTSTTGADGVDLNVTGRLQQIPGSARSLDISSPVRGGIDPIVETFSGAEGDVVYLLYSYAGQIPGLYIPLEHGPFVIDFTALDGELAGVIDASGVLVKELPPLPVLASGFFNLTTQAAFLRKAAGSTSRVRAS